MVEHTHQLVYIGQLVGEYGGEIPIRWCRECGTIVGLLVGGVSEIVPELAKEKVGDNAKFNFLPEGLPSSKRSSNKAVLGRSLNVIQASTPLLLALPGQRIKR